MPATTEELKWIKKKTVELYTKYKDVIPNQCLKYMSNCLYSDFLLQALNFYDIPKI